MNLPELSTSQKQLFLETLWKQYAALGRDDLPWRQSEQDGSFDPYKVMVSELMLQQTQVGRVVLKYEAFLGRFPDAKTLAAVELGAVLTQWQGLGYNRRAKFLWQAARSIAETGFPQNIPELVALPGIGKNTAGAILAYVFNQPVVFIETNIRTVYLHHFFADAAEVPDAAIEAILAETLDREQPREFYWALMDYGSWLKTQVRNNSQSKHYAKQSKFEGSRRQVRGKIIKLLAEKPRTKSELRQEIDDERITVVLGELTTEGLISSKGQNYTLA